MTNQMNEFIEQQADAHQELSIPKEYKTERIGFVDVQYGLNNDGDFVYHFTPAAPTKPFPDDCRPLVNNIIRPWLEKSGIPTGTTFNIHLPPREWEIKLVTIVATGVGKKWNFDEESYTKYIPKICDEITENLLLLYPPRSL